MHLYYVATGQRQISLDLQVCEIYFAPLETLQKNQQYADDPVWQ